MELYITYHILGFLKPSPDLHFILISRVLLSQALSLTCLAYTRIYMKSPVPSSGAKNKNHFFCATQIMLNSLSAGYIALGETETGRQTTHITLFTWYEPFHNEETHKCEQKKSQELQTTIKWTSLSGTLSKPYSDRKP